jgi:hypothetical protein
VSIAASVVQAKLPWSAAERRDLGGAKPAITSAPHSSECNRDVSFAQAKDGVQNIRDNNAARVAGPGRICFSSAQLAWKSAPFSVRWTNILEC